MIASEIASCKKDAVSKIRKGLVRRTAPRSLLQECSLQMRAHALRERRARRSCGLRPDAQGCQQLPTTPCVQWLRAMKAPDELRPGHAVATMPVAHAVPMAMPNSIAPNLCADTTRAPPGISLSTNWRGYTYATMLCPPAPAGCPPVLCAALYTQCHWHWMANNYSPVMA